MWIENLEDALKHKHNHKIYRQSLSVNRTVKKWDHWLSMWNRITDEKEEMYMSAGIPAPEKGQWEGDTEPIAKCSITDLKNHKTHLYIVVVEIKIKVRTRKLQRNFSSLL